MTQYSDATYPTTPSGSAMPDGEEGKRLGRRALIAAAGLGVVGVAAAEAPAILDGAKKLTQQELSAAINLGRQQLAEELANIEGVGIDVAIDAANITHGAVQIFVVPIANLVAGLTEITLGAAKFAVEKAQGFTQLLNIDIQALQTLDTIFTQWQTNVQSFPSIIQSINNTDTTSAKSYLTSLKTKLKQDAKSS